MRLSLTCLLVIAATHVIAAETRPDLPIASFEAADWGDWKVEGEAFGPGPAKGTLPNQMPVSDFEGQGLVNSYVGGDRPHGKLTSPDFVLSRNSIRFLIGGGRHPDKTCVNLLVDGKIVRTATGRDSEALDTESFDVAEFTGKKAHLEIVDEESGGWGHILADEFVQTDQVIPPAPREIALDKRYLILPIQNGGKTRKVSIRIGQKLIHQFDIALAEGKADFKAFIDVQPYLAQSATLTILPSGVKGPALLATIATADQPDGAADMYREPLRPQFHYTSRRGWLNDPNGLVFYAGEYHLFYQHNPYGTPWGNMHWGHAISPDLVHWQEQGDKLFPSVNAKGMVFSGSAIVDENNSAGFQSGPEKTLVAFFTDTDAGESMAYSTDKGRTWKTYAQNPVIKHAGRDPKVIWHQPTKSWVIAVYDEFSGKQYVAFYTSPDLKNWTFQSRTPGYFECPELFELPINGDEKNTRWILSDASFGYTVGQFDGKSFKPESPKKQLAAKGNFYAPQTWNNIPPQDGRRIIIGWMRDGKFPDMPFNQQMSFPASLTLHAQAANGPVLHANPIKEIESLHAKSQQIKDVTLFETENTLADLSGELLHLKLSIQPGPARNIVLTVRGQTFTYDGEKKTINGVPLLPENGAIQLEILVDRTSIELFANAGAVYMPLSFVLNDKDRSISLTTRGGKAKADVEFHELKSAWK